jgi:hypothetical protein
VVIRADRLAFARAKAPGCYNEIATSGLDERQRTVLLRVFVNWLEQRFDKKGKVEIEEMLLGSV